MSQISFLVEMWESELREERRRKTKEHFDIWKDAPDLYLVPGEDRQKMKYYPSQTDYDIYVSTIHICGENKDYRHIWLNDVSRVNGNGEYWVLRNVEGPGGEHITKCPYCGASLVDGEGRIALEKADRADKYERLGYKIRDKEDQP